VHGYITRLKYIFNASIWPTLLEKLISLTPAYFAAQKVLEQRETR
jgi:hypothetical protein